MDPSRITLTPIGVVESMLTDPSTAPKQGREGGPDAWLVFDERVLDGLRDIRPGDEVVVLTWLDRARRDVLRVHPRDDASSPLTGVFSTRFFGDQWGTKLDWRRTSRNNKALLCRAS
jgi:tRNA (Thr-GGU) A37 N-methylase